MQQYFGIFIVGWIVGIVINRLLNVIWKIPLNNFCGRSHIVHFLNSVSYVAIFHIYGFNTPAIVYCAFISILIIISIVNLFVGIIPNKATLPGIVIGVFLGSTILPDPFMRDSLLGIVDSILGLITGGGLLYILAIGGKAVLKKTVVGGGAIKMMAMIGSIIGWKSIVLIIPFSFITPFIEAFIRRITTHDKENIEMGPYVALGALICILFGQDILLWYLY